MRPHAPTACDNKNNCQWKSEICLMDYSSGSVYRLQAWCRINKYSSCECHNKLILYAWCAVRLLKHVLAHCHCVTQHVRNDVECRRGSRSRGGRTVWHFQLDWSVSTLGSWKGSESVFDFRYPTPFLAGTIRCPEENFKGDSVTTERCWCPCCL